MLRNNKLILRKNQLDRLREETKHIKIAYFVAHTGWGKTTTVLQYLDTEHMTYSYISARDDNCLEQIQNAMNENIPNIVIDDFQCIGEYSEKIVEIIALSSHLTHFYILSRANLPSCLKAFYTTRQLIIYDISFFVLNTDEVNELAKLYDISLSVSVCKQIMEFNSGWILGVIFTLRHIGNENLTEQIKESARYDIFGYFDEVLFNTFSEDVQKFLLNVGHLSEFNRKQAEMICGERDLDSVIEETLDIGSFVEFIAPDTYKFNRLFHRYLVWKQKKECKQDAINRKYERTALYYSLNDDITNALKYYSLAGNDEKVAEILVKNADNHAGNAYFRELKDYYFSLPNELISKSPTLMSALSMICSLYCRVDESEHYYDMLKSYEKGLATNDKQKKKAQENLAYLDIALPHRGTKNLVDIFKGINTLIGSNHSLSKTMSITGNMPSLMNGGKDFCEWSKKDKLLYKTMGKLISMVLGKSSEGLADIGLAESQFGKNYDGNLTQELMLLNVGLSKCETSTNTQLQFAALSVMARIYASQGNYSEAISIIEKFKANNLSNKYILSNVDAFLTYLHMMINDTQYIDTWFEKEAPDEYHDFFIMERYRYLIKVRVYIIKEMYMQALALIGRLDNYFTGYDRKYCYMQSQLLKAIALYRMKDSSYREVLNTVLKECEKYQFIHIVSDEGVAILDMLKNSHNIKEDYKDKLLESTKRQATLYPKYLKTQTKNDYSLTDTEKTVLKLICDGLSNEEIAKLTDTSLRTVKFHLGNIYMKLDVKGRTGAINFCLENNIL